MDHSPQINTNNEILDVVDQENHVIGQALRDEIHKKGLRHRSAHLLIYNACGELFLQKRSKLKDDFPSFWDSSAAGHVDAGESYEDCVKREAQEELGIVLIAEPESCFMLPASAENGMEFCQVFRCVHEGPFDLDAYEVETGSWFTAQVIEDWINKGGEGLTPSIKVMLSKLAKDD